MGKVFVDVGMSIDGFIAGLNGRPKNPLGNNGLKIHDWMFKQKAFLQHLGLEGGEINTKDGEIIIFQSDQKVKKKLIEFLTHFLLAGK